ncbi:hypothetical protein FQN50_008514 [Emmonsiellopsis sp. PD_5]|nr:hypothetical protein FQN50_008514 [Emmonsiellopsis sp. PD_5]
MMPLLSTAPKSQFSDIECPSQFNLATFIDEAGIFETQLPDPTQPLNEKLLADHMENEYFLQDDNVTEVEAELEAGSDEELNKKWDREFNE